MATPYPFYLEGTQTAGLFQQPMGAPTQYVPGSGMPLYNQTTATPIYPPSNGSGQQIGSYSSLDEAIRAAAPYGQGAINDAVAAFNSQQTVIGQGEAWLSPDELRAKTNALETRGGPDSMGSVSGSSSGGAVPGAATGATASATGGLLGGGQGMGGQLSGPTVGGFPGIQSGGLNNYLPSGQVNGAPQMGGNTQGGQLPMMQSGPQSGLQQYYNTPGYQLTNGMGAVNQFQTSPGYQFAVDQALGQVQSNAASRGLLDSGAALRAMTDRAQGMANQEFNNWQQNQQAQYNQYQNRLAGLAEGPTGSDQAFALGQGMGNNAMQTGSNIGSLLANQGNSLFGGIVGAGGAQAQNVTQAGNMQAQILAGNLSTQLAAAALAGGRR